MNLRTVTLWCCYDYNAEAILDTSPTKRRAAESVKGAPGTILLKLTGQYVRPSKAKANSRRADSTEA